MQFLVNHIQTNWKEFISDQFKLTYINAIDKFLALADEEIFPQKNDIFKAFDYFDIEDTKVVIFGQDPYHTPKIANGLAFSVNKENKIPPSLRNLFLKLKLEMHIDRLNPDLSDWAEQGFLLLNTTLTVFANKPASNSHIGWDIFTKNCIEQLNHKADHVVFVLLGNHAKQLRPFIDESKHLVIEHVHPSPLVPRERFLAGQIFSTIDEYVTKYKSYHIKW